MPEPESQRLVERLTAAESPARSQLAQQLVSYVLSQRLRDVVAPAELAPIVIATLTRENLAREFARAVLPGVRRYSDRVAQDSVRVADLISEEAVTALRKQLEQPTAARGRWAKGAVDPALLKKLLGPVWVQLLVNFAKRIPGLGSSAAAPAAGRGIASVLGRSVQQGAERLVGAGKSALEGLGIDVEKKLMSAARDFSDGALSIWNQALRERLESAEGRAILTQIKHGILSHVLQTELRAIDRDAVALPLAAYLELAPLVVGHAVGVPFIRKLIDDEVQTYLAREGDRRLDELLSELSVLEQTRTWLLARVESQLLGFCATPLFAEWLSTLLAERSASITT